MGLFETFFFFTKIERFSYEQETEEPKILHFTPLYLIANIEYEVLLVVSVSHIILRAHLLDSNDLPFQPALAVEIKANYCTQSFTRDKFRCKFFLFRRPR